MNLVITGGGTGGHIFAGVAIAQEFLSQSKANRALFIGSEFGLEKKLVPKHGYNLETLRLGKLVGQSVVQRILTVLQIPIATLKCIFILRKFKADFVVGVGGYAAGPCIIASRILGIPTAILEQNAVMGFTNRLSSYFAHHVFLAFAMPLSGVPEQKCIYTGNPTRIELKPAKKSESIFTVFIFGGSQGAHGINQLMTKAAQYLADIKNEIRIIHQTGERDFDWVQKAYQEAGLTAEVFRFIDNMQEMYNRASVVVCRAGSSTLSELSATQNAAILIPFPHAASNHQEFNARQLEHLGGAEVLLEAQTTGAELAQRIIQFKNAPEKLQEMREKIKEFYRPNAASQIIEIMKIRALKHPRF